MDKKVRNLFEQLVIISLLPLNAIDFIALFIVTQIYTLLFKKFKKMNMPYYIAFLALFLVFGTAFSIEMALDRSPFFAYNVTLIIIVNYFLPEERKDLFRYIYVYIIAAVILRNTINHILVGAVLLYFLYELLKEEKNKKLYITLFAIFFVFSFVSFQTSINPFKDFSLFMDKKYYKTYENENNIENNKINVEDENTEKKERVKRLFKESETNPIYTRVYKPQETMTQKEKLFLGVLVLGVISSLVIAYYSYKYMTKKDKKRLYISLALFFIITFMGLNTIAHLKPLQYKLETPEFFTSNIEKQISKEPTAINREDNAIAANSTQTTYNGKAEILILKIAYLIIKFSRYVYLINILILAYFIYKILKKDKDSKKEDLKFKELKNEKFKEDKFDEKDIPYLIDKGYIYIRKRFFEKFQHLTPYELLRKVDSPEEFKKLTDLFILKEYGNKDYNLSKKEIINLINSSIEHFKTQEI
ncbi:hypothetical protein [Marinitoga sp. 1138]|uniref:hypothetical protein n=1 Tax=Marinitoga sp. 1138 TaxID=1643334 RepID=UPI001586DFE1|nr:hypothetical protein [Marinitoga sp. 1138]NUU97486.1 hypothetical protein [Marinitoga sp. 1138]